MFKIKNNYDRALKALSFILFFDENLSNTNSINSINTSISSLNTKVSTNTNNINTINTRLNGLSFAKDNSGNWGYKVGGAGSVIPFKNKYRELRFSSATDAQIAEIVSALDAGTITTNDLSWEVGDMRKVHLSAMPEIHSYTTTTNQPEQDVTFAIYNIGGVTLTNGKPCHYVVGLRNVLKGGGPIHTDRSIYLWEDSARRTWLNNTFRNALPASIRGCFKQFKCISILSFVDKTITTTDDYFTLPADKEIYGERAVSNAESNALIQFEWYKIRNNVIKTNEHNPTSGTSTYWERTSSDRHNFLSAEMYSNGYSHVDYCDNRHGISPFGCI